MWYSLSNYINDFGLWIFENPRNIWSKFQILLESFLDSFTVALVLFFKLYSRFHWRFAA